MVGRCKAAHECLIETDGAQELLLSVLIQNSDGFFLISARAELELPSGFRLLLPGNVQPCQIKGEALLVILLAETAHGIQEFVQG